MIFATENTDSTENNFKLSMNSVFSVAKFYEKC